MTLQEIYEHGSWNTFMSLTPTEALSLLVLFGIIGWAIDWFASPLIRALLEHFNKRWPWTGS